LAQLSAAIEELEAHDELESREGERSAEPAKADELLDQQLTERGRIGEMFQSERESFRSILEGMSDGVYIANPQYDIQYANPLIKKEFGPIDGQKCYEYFHDKKEACPWCKNQEVYAKKKVQWEWHSSRTGKTYELFDVPFPDADGTTSRLEIFRDITGRKQAEEALRASEIKYRIVADNTYDWEWWRDPAGKFVYNSPSCQKVTHHNCEEFVDDPDLLLRIIYPEDQASFNRHQIEVEEKHSPGETEFRILRPDGSIRWIAHACQPIYDEQGRFLGRRGSNRDITERKQAEQDLRESERQLRLLSSQILSAQETERRRISRELHDELGGGLAALKLRLSFIERKLQKEQAELREECRQNLEYIDQLIHNTDRLSRDLSPSILEDFGFTPALRRLIDSIVKNYNIKAEYDIADVNHLFPKDEQFAVYRILQEALTNVGKHAQAKNVSLRVWQDDHRICFSVEDDGKGFDVKQVAMTEASERGLGLAIMDERSRMLGGSLDLWSEEGKGTRITLNIPVKEGESL
jgi:PAS domain S-box-containing protein